MRKRWLSKRALAFHLAILIWAPGCFYAGYWQVTVALSGNSLSYLYSVEWPVFALFGIYVWWKMIHDDPESLGMRGLQHAREKGESEGTWHASDNSGVTRHKDEEDENLKAYNDYLESLARSDTKKTWQKR